MKRTLSARLAVLVASALLLPLAAAQNTHGCDAGPRAEVPPGTRPDASPAPGAEVPGGSWLELPTPDVPRVRIAPGGPLEWEPIAADYSNVRGLNYVPHWAGSSVGTWKGYDAEQVERDLGYLNGIGCNTIRVWMSEIVYRTEGPLFLAKFRDLLERCEAHRIYVIVVVWDDIGAQPSATPYDDTDEWVKNPSTANQLDPLFWRDYGDAYVRDLVCVARKSPALLLWDVMNEPGTLKDLLKHYAALIKAQAPSHQVTIGWAAAHSNAVTAGWPEIDVLSYHPYGCFQQNIQSWTATIRDISEESDDKPYLASEVASPGLMQRYEDIVPHMSGEGVGFLLFQAMIGPPPHFLYFQDGFFYEDGEVRDPVGVQAFQDLSVAQGYAGELRPIVEKLPGDPLFLPMYPIPVGFGGPELITALADWESRPMLNGGNAPFYMNLCIWASISISWLGELYPEEFAAVQTIKANFDAAFEVGDYAAADVWLSHWGYWNWFFIQLYDLNG